MSTAKTIGIVLIVGAIICLGIAYQQSGSFGDSTKHFFTGNYRDNTTWLIIIGAVVGVLGLASLVVPSGNSRS